MKIVLAQETNYFVGQGIPPRRLVTPIETVRIGGIVQVGRSDDCFYYFLGDQKHGGFLTERAKVIDKAGNTVSQFIAPTPIPPAVLDDSDLFVRANSDPRYYCSLDDEHHRQLGWE